MEQKLLTVLKDAVKNRQRKEDLDRSVGRAVRKHGLDFQIYVAMMSELRDLAKENDITVEAAADRLLAKKE